MHSTNSTPLAAPLSPRSDAEVIGLVGLAHGTSHFFHLMLPPLFPWLISDFGLSFTQVGFLTTVFFVISGAGQALAGFVVDRVGARPVLFAGISLLALSGLALGFAQSYSMLFVAAAMAGVGNSVFHPVDFTLLNRCVSQPRLGHAFSIHGLTGNIGWAIAPVFMASIASAWDWHAAGFGAAGVGAVVLAVLFARRHVLEPAAHQTHTPSSAEPASRPLDYLRSSPIWFCFAFFLFASAAFAVLQNFGAPVLAGMYGLGPVVASSGLTAYLVGSACGMVTGGFIAARYRDNDRPIALALGLAAAIAVLVATGYVPAWSVIGLLALMGFGVGIAGPNRDLLVRRAATARFGKTSYGRVYGFVYSGLDVGVAASPLVFGPLMDRGHLGAVLTGVALLQVLAIVVALRVGRFTRS